MSHPLAAFKALTVLAAATVLTLSGCSTVESTATPEAPSTAPETTAPETSAAEVATDLPLAGKKIGIAVVGTQHFWDQQAFEGAVETVEALGGETVTTDGGRDNTKHAENHDIFLSAGVDAVITILGDDAVEPKLAAIKAQGIPVFGVDHASENVVNNAQSDSVKGGTQAGEILADYLNNAGKANAKVAVFNAFSESLTYCGERYENWKKTLQEKLPGVEILEPELAELFANPIEDAASQTKALLEKYKEGQLDAIHVACWDQPAIGAVQAIEESGRTDVVVTAFDAGPDTLKIQAEEGSPFVGNVAQQPRKIGQTAAENVAKYFTDGSVEAVTYVDTFPAAGVEGAKQVYEQLGYGTI
jgi:ribose transport system substrate-binding protein